ncbi:MAG TPA: DUF1223 domain-containing protein [Candidatus Angelobacter sp.]|nr:DUF1223 domain-containing protein [Candidatus Angelobacter sp.]
MRILKSIWLWGFLLVTGVTVPLLLATQNKPQASEPSARKAVVVELFTSEGCSDCPPADALLARLRRGPAPDGAEVITLGLHVDYWNSQGWKDRFSSSDYSERQQRYASKLRLGGPYTPQMVVDGVSQFVGNDPRAADQAIRDAARRPQSATVQIADDGSKLDVTVKAPQQTSGDVMLAITEDNLMTKVTAGENNKRELHHAAVVRDLRSLGRLHDGNFEAAFPLKLNKDWKRDDLRIVVFVQEPHTGPILGAASLQLMATSAAK